MNIVVREEFLVDAKLLSDFDVEDETVSLDRILQALDPARRLRLVMLDACLKEAAKVAGLELSIEEGAIFVTM